MSVNPEPGTKFPLLAVLIGIGIVGAVVAVATVAQGDEPDLGEQIAARQVRQAAQGESVTCPNGQSVQTYFQRDAERFELVGTLTSLDAQTLTIDAPQGEVQLAVATNVETEGDILPGDVARINGSVARDGVFVASGIEGVCEVFVAEVATDEPETTPAAEATEAAAEPIEDDEEAEDEAAAGEGDDDDEGDGNSGRGNGNGGRGNGEGNGGEGNGGGNGGGGNDDDDDEGDDD